MYSQELGDYIKVYTPEGIEIGKWYTVIGTYDGSNRKIYLNGELMGSEPASEAIKQSSATILLGANPGGSSKNIDGDYLHATFSEALIFDRALTAEEIKTNYNAIPKVIFLHGINFMNR